MKYYAIVLLISLCSSIIFCQDDRFVSAIQKNLSMMDTASSAASYQVISNNFERIANAEKTKWQPYYYSAFCLAISSFMDTVNTAKDLYLDKAEVFTKIADSLKPNNSEIFVVKAMIALGRMIVDPMSRYQTYGAQYQQFIDKATELDPTNPRPDFLQGQTTYNTPQQYGGGKEAAKPKLVSAKEKFDKFVPEDSVAPNWGKQQVEQMLQSYEQ